MVLVNESHNNIWKCYHNDLVGSFSSICSCKLSAFFLAVHSCGFSLKDENVDSFSDFTPGFLFWWPRNTCPKFIGTSIVFIYAKDFKGKHIKKTSLSHVAQGSVISKKYIPATKLYYERNCIFWKKNFPSSRICGFIKDVQCFRVDAFMLFLFLWGNILLMIIGV